MGTPRSLDPLFGSFFENDFFKSVAPPVTRATVWITTFKPEDQALAEALVVGLVKAGYNVGPLSPNGKLVEALVCALSAEKKDIDVSEVRSVLNRLLADYGCQTYSVIVVVPALTAHTAWQTAYLAPAPASEATPPDAPAAAPAGVDTGT